ncbi:MAG: GNAT family N-acetyltransferase [Deltaproteobacteria bacterium]|nr:GNAT family N-acetyltransferase [Deltaproteobacteria bacterium]
MTVVIRPMTITDFDAVRALWTSCEGVGLNDADRPEALRAYLVRNPGMSFVAQEDDAIVGAVLCGHDGRRGYLNHLAVSPAHRYQGIARRLVSSCLAALKAAGIGKCHLFIFSSNQDGQNFWQKIGWELRDDLAVASRTLSPE